MLELTLEQHELVSDAISKNDLEALKAQITATPKLLATLDFEDDSLLNLSIIYDRYEIFKYLLSLDHFDLEATNHQQETPLMLALALDSDNEDYAISLINKGAQVNCKSSYKDTPLHLALQRHLFKVAHHLIEKGAFLNAQNCDRCTPFHMLFHTKIDPGGVVEGVGMMIYYGADASIRDNNGSLPFDLAVIYDESIVVAQENLLYYTFDEHFKYEMSNEVLFELLQTRSPLVFQISEFVSGLVFIDNVFFSPGFFLKLDHDILRVVIDKFDTIIRFCMNFPVLWYDFLGSSFSSWEILMNSFCAADTRQFIAKLRIEDLIEKMQEKEMSDKDIMDLIFYLLSHGLNIYVKDFEVVYRIYGYCELFTVMLHMDVTPGRGDVFPRIIYDIHFDLNRFIDDPHDFSINALEKLLMFFARPKLKKLCNKLGVKKLINRAETLPKVPFLVELARDATRKFLVEEFKIQKTSQFYTLLNVLPIGRPHCKILSFQTRLYL